MFFSLQCSAYYTVHAAPSGFVKWLRLNKFSCIFFFLKKCVFSGQRILFKFSNQLFFEMVQRWQMDWLLKSRNGSFKKVDHPKINENTPGKEDVTGLKKNGFLKFLSSCNK